jgi:hypothetical protein
MRASDLLGSRVVDAGGAWLGWVTDLRCVQDGPLRGSTTAALRVDALVVSRRRSGSPLGYDRRRQQGPWLIRAVVRTMHRHLQVIEWSQVERYGEKTITVRTERAHRGAA